MKEGMGDLGSALLVGVGVVDAVDLLEVGLEGAALGEGLLALPALVRPHPWTHMDATVMQVTEGAQRQLAPIRRRGRRVARIIVQLQSGEVTVGAAGVGRKGRGNRCGCGCGA